MQAKQPTTCDYWGLAIVSLLLLAGLAWGFLVSGSGTEQVPLEDLGPAPAIILPDLEGRSVDLGNFKGQVLLVDFWGTWCKSCVDEMPHLEQIFRTYRKDGFVIMAIAVEFGRNETENRRKVQDKITDLDITFPVVMGDDAAVQAFGGNVENFPQAYLIDRQGNVRKKIVGAREHAFWDALIRSALR